MKITEEKLNKLIKESIKKALCEISFNTKELDPKIRNIFQSLANEYNLTLLSCQPYNDCFILKFSVPNGMVDKGYVRNSWYRDDAIISNRQDLLNRILEDLYYNYKIPVDIIDGDYYQAKGYTDYDYESGNNIITICYYPEPKRITEY